MDCLHHCAFAFRGRYLGGDRQPRGEKIFFPTVSTAVPSRSRRSRNIRRALEVVEVIVIAVVVAVVVIIKWCCVWRDNVCCADEIAKMVI